MSSDYVKRSFPLDSGFSVIEKWTDMAPFAGKIVAVDSPSCVFAQTFLGQSEAFYATRRTSAFTFPDHTFAFAYVSQKTSDRWYGGEGYPLSILLKKEAVDSSNIVNKSTLEDDNPLALRVALPDELLKIRSVVLSAFATFSTCTDSREVPREPLKLLMSLGTFPEDSEPCPLCLDAMPTGHFRELCGTIIHFHEANPGSAEHRAHLACAIGILQTAPLPACPICPVSCDLKTIAIRLLSDYSEYTNTMRQPFWTPPEAIALKEALDTLDEKSTPSLVKLQEEIMAYYPKVRFRL